jgi:hypothetical protein
MGTLYYTPKHYQYFKSHKLFSKDMLATELIVLLLWLGIF